MSLLVLAFCVYVQLRHIPVLSTVSDRLRDALVGSVPLQEGLPFHLVSSDGRKHQFSRVHITGPKRRTIWTIGPQRLCHRSISPLDLVEILRDQHPHNACRPASTDQPWQIIDLRECMELIEEELLATISAKRYVDR